MPGRLTFLIALLVVALVAGNVALGAAQTPPQAGRGGAAPPPEPSPTAPLYRHTGEQYRIYNFPGTGESIPYRLFVPTTWTPERKLPMLVTLIRGARAVIFPSLYEGFGLPVLEAMLLGTPVVTSRASSLPEIAGDAALYVNPYDIDEIAEAIKTITADADLRAELARRGRVQAELFSVARYRERLAALYERLG